MTKMTQIFNEKVNPRIQKAEEKVAKKKIGNLRELGE
jgi:hypothetical protein